MPALETLHHVERHDLAVLVASALYGTISAAVVIAVLDEDVDTPGEFVGRTLATVVVLWLAHVYSHWMGATIAHRVEGSRQLAREALLTSPVVLAAVPLLAPVVLAAAGVCTVATATETSSYVALAILALGGLLVGLRRRLPPLRVLGLVLRSALLGGGVVVLESLVH